MKMTKFVALGALIALFISSSFTIDEKDPKLKKIFNGKNFDEITNDIYNDEEINKKRHFYYRPNKLV